MFEKTKERREKELEPVMPSRTLSHFEELDRMFDRMFEEFFPRGWMRPFHPGHGWWPEVGYETRVPRMDVIDREEDVLVRAELPGVEKEDLKVSLTEDTVTIEAESHREESEEKENFFRHEIARGGFSRTMPLPCHVKDDKGKAHFKGGVLELTLPKVEKAKRLTVEVE